MKIGKFCTMGMQIVHKRFVVEIWQYSGAEHNRDFRNDVDYIKKPAKAFFNIGAEQKLVQNMAITLAGNQQIFFFDENEIGGLDRNIEVGQDLVFYNNTKFHVIEKSYEALDDYVAVKGQQFAQLAGKNPVSYDAPIDSPASYNIFGA